MDDKEWDITTIFLDVMELVKAKRELARMESRLTQQCGAYGVDRRIANILANEYEIFLETSTYKMKTIKEIQEEVLGVDDEQNNVRNGDERAVL
jgi:hypothetical protein